VRLDQAGRAISPMCGGFPPLHDAGCPNTATTGRTRGTIMILEAKNLDDTERRRFDHGELRTVHVARRDHPGHLQAGVEVGRPTCSRAPTPTCPADRTCEWTT